MPQRQKLRIEEKVKLIQSYLRGEVSITTAAQSAGVDGATMWEWVRNYEADGVDAFLPQKNRVYSPELRRQAVEDYLSSKGSIRDICKKHRIRNKRQLINWLKVYNGGGDLGSVKHSGGGSYMKQGRETTQAERIEIAKACLACGKNYGEVALKYQVSYQQARSWTKRFEELGEAGLEDRRGKRKRDQEPRTELEKMQIEIEQLKHKLYMAEMERDLLKKLDEVERRYASHK